MNIYTIGFTKKSAETFFETISKSGVTRVLDTRLNNVSQLAGFAKKTDLIYFLEKICNVEYVHMTELAPTQDMLDEYKKLTHDWKRYEKKFVKLIEKRKIETLSKSLFKDSCLLCSEEKPHQCHRRLVAEYLKAHWGKVTINHL